MTKIANIRPTAPTAAGLRRAWVHTRPVTERRETRAPAPSTRWAVTPLHTPHGQAVAVRLEGQELRVALRQPYPAQCNSQQTVLVWRPAEQVLTPAQAARWVATGFRR